jgi:hypothetical protein
MIPEFPLLCSGSNPGWDHQEPAVWYAVMCTPADIYRDVEETRQFYVQTLKAIQSLFCDRLIGIVCRNYCVVLKLDIIHYSETSVDLYSPTQRYIPNKLTLHNPRESQICVLETDAKLVSGSAGEEPYCSRFRPRGRPSHGLKD